MQRHEETLHRAAVAYLRAALPKPWDLWHTPNGGGRSKAEAGILKAMGTRAGVPDLFVMGPQILHPREWLGELTSTHEMVTAPRLIAIEFKAPPKRLRSGGPSKARPRLSPAQASFQAYLGRCGVPYLVIDDMAEMVQKLKALGVPLKARVL